MQITKRELEQLTATGIGAVSNTRVIFDHIMANNEVAKLSELLGVSTSRISHIRNSKQISFETILEYLMKLEDLYE